MTPSTSSDQPQPAHPRKLSPAERRHLMQLPDYLLLDIGVTRDGLRA